MPVPTSPKLYHIAHVDKLPLIIREGSLLCDATILGRPNAGTTIGMSSIKQRRQTLEVECHPGLYVGQCVPFYFCPRSVMLYLLYKANHSELTYQGGQNPIVHLEFDMHEVIAWAGQNNKRWAFTLSNAGAFYFESRNNIANLDEINWESVNSDDWAGSHKEGKQAEFLVEQAVPWGLVRRIGVKNLATSQLAGQALQGAGHHPLLEIKPLWYY